ncbi:hypothetical protein WMY93_033876 [Mugilogobius chulae]|uniref:Uncharacterized protein n=1 Tax=Mugilogobius chulae TaxID=88201 RepID=A0AAW0MJB8_9GOBI
MKLMKSRLGVESPADEDELGDCRRDQKCKDNTESKTRPSPRSRLFQVQSKTKTSEFKMGPSPRQDQVQEKTEIKTRPSSRQDRDQDKTKFKTRLRQDRDQDKTEFRTRPSSRQD